MIEQEDHIAGCVHLSLHTFCSLEERGVNQSGNHTPITDLDEPIEETEDTTPTQRADESPDATDLGVTRRPYNAAKSTTYNSDNNNNNNNNADLVKVSKL